MAPTRSRVAATASVIYSSGAGRSSFIPYGAGEIVTLGWDFFGSPPYLGADIGQAAWFGMSTRNRQRATVRAADRAVRRPAFIDMIEGPSGGPNLSNCYDRARGGSEVRNGVRRGALARRHAAHPRAGGRATLRRSTRPP
jgi:hypothetical protein